MMWGDTPIDRRKFVGGAAAGLGAGLAGCPDQTGDGETTDDDTGPTDVQEGGTLVIGQGGDLQSYNLFSSGNAFGINVLRRIYDTGLAGNPQTERPVPRVFQDWEINVENFGTDSPAIVGDMLEGHTWHDGEEVTAGDVAFTHNFMEEQGTTGTPFGTPNYFERAEADSEDGYTVSWYLSEVAANAMLGTIAQIVIPEHIWQDVSEVSEYDPRQEGELIGSGPFEIGETNDGEFYELTTRPKDEIPWNEMEEYSWLDPDGPFIDGVRFEIFSSSSALFQSILDGEVHMSVGTQTLDQAVQATQRDSIEAIQNPSATWTMIGYNTRRVPFDDVAFRQFMRKTINQRWVVETQMQNIASEAGEYVVAKPWEFWRPPEVSELLAEADSDDVYAPTQYVNERIADEDIVEPVDIPNLKYPRDSAQWPTPNQETVDELRNFLLEHPKAKHDYSLGEAQSSGMDSIDGQEIYVNGEPLGTAHTNNDGQQGQGPIEFNDFPPTMIPQGFERMTKWLETVQAIGLPTTRSTQSWAQTQPKIYQREDFDVMTQVWPGLLWYVTHLTWMLSGTRDNIDVESDDDSTNWNAYAYTGADDLIAEQDTYVDPEQRQPWIKQALAQIYHDQPQSVGSYPKVLATVSVDYDGYVSAVGGVFNDHTLLNARQTGGQ